jgi:predicted dehydrogenase
MLRVGIIGYGRRVAHMAKAMNVFGIPYQVVAVADPRASEIQAQNDRFLADAAFYTDADELLDHAVGLDGIMIGTRCHLHTEMACKVAKHDLPLFLEKPVAISFDQVQQLQEAFAAVTAPVVVSFPLRLSPIAQKVKALLEDGIIGQVEQMVAFNDVPYGSIYYRSWYRNYEQSGGLFLQKATHDLDYLHYLIGQHPRQISAMNARRVYGGDMPFDLQCHECTRRENCPESPFVHFRLGFEGEQVDWNGSDRFCVFAEGLELEDMGSCQIEYENGAQLSYTQNFFARYQAAQRGARLYGYRGTLVFDWYRNQIQIFSHTAPTVQTIDFTGDMPHFGGDRELCYDFLMAMRDRRPSRSPLSAGILSALTCLWARKSATTRQMCLVTMPGKQMETQNPQETRGRQEQDPMQRRFSR